MLFASMIYTDLKTLGIFNIIVPVLAGDESVDVFPPVANTVPSGYWMIQHPNVSSKYLLNPLDFGI